MTDYSDKNDRLLGDMPVFRYGKLVYDVAPYVALVGTVALVLVWNLIPTRFVVGSMCLIWVLTWFRWVFVQFGWPSRHRYWYYKISFWFIVVSGLIAGINGVVVIVMDALQ